MKIPKMYLDTSIISHLRQEDVPEKMRDTIRFWDAIKAGEYDVAISQVTLDEIDRCPEPKKNELLRELSEITYQFIEPSIEIEAIAAKFVENNILTVKNIDDCRHIAASIVCECDAIVSWNFKHIVNYKTIRGVKLISLMTGYKEVAIYTPTILIAGGETDD
jgi:predicted nucleic acid-binding protein